MDLNELKRLISEEVKRKREDNLLKEQEDKTAGRPKKPPQQSVNKQPEPPAPDEEPNLDIPAKETTIKPEITNIPLQNLLNSVVSDQDFKTLDQETQNAVQSVMKSLSLLENSFNVLANSSMRNKNASWDLLTYIGEIAKKIAVITKTIPTGEPSLQQRKIASLTNRDGSGYEAKPDAKTVSRLPGQPGPQDPTATAVNPSADTAVRRLKNKLGFKQE